MTAKSKIVLKYVAWIGFAEFSCWWIAQRYYWQRGWNHYEAGGGVLVNDDIDEKEMRAALESFRTAARINPWSVKYKNYSGQALIELGQYDDALIELESALAVSPRSFTANYEKAYALLKLARYPEMVGSLRAAIQLQGQLNRVVRFSEEFAHVRDEPFMQEFDSQY